MMPLGSDIELLHGLFRNDIFIATCIDHEPTYFTEEGVGGLEDVGW